MSYKTSDVYRTGFLTVDGTLDSNNSQLYFRPLQRPLQPVSGHFYSLAPNQTTDPTIRINQYSSNGTLLKYGFLYDTQFNPLPPGLRLLVAGGVGGSIMIYSTDGVTWYPSINGLTVFNECKCITWNGYTWVAGGSSTSPAKLAYSSNGTIWNNSSTGTAILTQGCNASTTNGSLWVAGGKGISNIVYGYDGINWFPSVTGSLLLSDRCLAAAWNGAVWLLGGVGSSSIIYSSDGLSWFPSNNGLAVFSQCSALAWNGSQWIAGGIPQTGQTHTVAFSYDGINWTGVSSLLRTTCLAVAWSGAQWVAGGTDPSNNTLIYSSNGLTWNQAPDVSGLFTSCNSIAWTGTQWIAGGTGSNSFLESYDGINWVPLASPNFLLSTCNAVAINKILPNAAIEQHLLTKIPSTPVTVLGGSAINGSVLSNSYDGITWDPIVSAKLFGTTTCLAIGWNGRLWQAGFSRGGDYTLGNSSDGTIWNGNASGTSYLSYGCYSVVSSSSIWLAGGSSGPTGSTRMIRSTDGLVWAPVTEANTLFDTSECNTIGWNGSTWVAGSDSSSNRLIYSTDPLAITWLASNSGTALFSTTCSAVSWNGSLWVAVGGSTIAYSSNGINWSLAASVPAFSSLLTVAWNDSMWVAGGIGTDPLAYSYDGSTWLSSANGSSVFTTSCQSVLWNGTLWIAAGTGLNTAAYSYNGVTWIPSYNSTSVISAGQSLGTNRALSFAGPTPAPPVLYPVPASTVGNATYSTGLNNLNVSSILTINDSSGSIGINRTPRSYSATALGTVVTPTLDISGQALSVSTDAVGQWPTLYLTNTNTTTSSTGYAGRVVMQNISSNWGWSIDSLWNTTASPSINEHMQFIKWKSGASRVAADFDDLGRLGLNCTANNPSNPAANFQLDINGDTRVRSQLFVTGNTRLADVSANVLEGQTLRVTGRSLMTDLSANTIQGQTLRITGRSLVTDLSANAIQGQTISATTSIASVGSIASSLAISSRGSTNIPVNITTGGNSVQNWNYLYSVSGSASNYSVFLVNVNAVFDASNITPGQLMGATLDISVNGVTKYFLAGTSDVSGIKLYPVSFSFIVNPIANSISVQGIASNGVFVNTNGTNFLTTVDILGIT